LIVSSRYTRRNAQSFPGVSGTAFKKLMPRGCVLR
jgi:hypothetical protein